LLKSEKMGVKMSKNALQQQFLDNAVRKQALDSHYKKMRSGELVLVPGTDACMTAESYRNFVAELHEQGFAIKRNPLAYADCVMYLPEIVTPKGTIDNGSTHAVALIDFRGRQLKAEARNTFNGEDFQDCPQPTAETMAQSEAQPAQLEPA
jgi:hypothetical protein